MNLEGRLIILFSRNETEIYICYQIECYHNLRLIEKPTNILHFMFAKYKNIVIKKCYTINFCIYHIIYHFLLKLLHNQLVKVN